MADSQKVCGGVIGSATVQEVIADHDKALRNSGGMGVLSLWAVWDQNINSTVSAFQKIAVIAGALISA